jgi:phosphoglycolate phosphatase
MSPIRLVILDFDGTLADSFPWFLGVLNGVADRYRFRRVREDEVEMLRGRGARQIIAHLGIPFWKLPLVARHMRRLAARDAERIGLFDGVPDMLDRLAASGLTLAVVTSNSEENVRRTLGPSASRIAIFSCGTSTFGKAARFRAVAKRAGAPPEAVLCVGDELRDAEAARACGMRFGAVGWGYTRLDALLAASPDIVFRDVREIADVLTRPASSPA